jgi:hypothetical protein
LGICLGSVLETGSLKTRHSQDYRSLFKGRYYIGTDQTNGEGVDLVWDLTNPPPESLMSSPSTSAFEAEFGTILCMSVLEHCEKPWLMAGNLEDLLYPSGVLMLSVPFAWRYHPQYGGDYWRFTPDAVRSLFPNLNWDKHPGCLCTHIDGDFRDRDEDPTIREHKLLLPTMINMIGVKP